jgi:2-(1,2-epoxy-1,2-dihydrophenyl)acetyl-CoA isomerase
VSFHRDLLGEGCPGSEQRLGGRRAWGRPRDGHARRAGPAEQLTAPLVLQTDRMIGLPPHALAMAKPLLRAAADAGWETALTMEQFAEPNCFATAPFRSAARARLEGSSS